MMIRSITLLASLLVLPLSQAVAGGCASSACAVKVQAFHAPIVQQVQQVQHVAVPVVQQVHVAQVHVPLQFQVQQVQAFAQVHSVQAVAVQPVCAVQRVCAVQQVQRVKVLSARPARARLFGGRSVSRSRAVSVTRGR